MLTIDASSLLDWGEQLGAASGTLKQELQAAATESAEIGAQIAKQILRSNGSVVTGGLLDSIEARGGGSSGSLIHAEYGPSEERPGKWVEHGRGPVYARDGGSLKFQIKGSGPYIYTKSVGPAAPRPFMAPSVETLRPIAIKLLGEAVMRAVSKAR